MSEEELTTSIEVYKTQLSQVEAALEESSDSADLQKLRDDLLQLVQLTEASLLSVKKSRLLLELEAQLNEDDLSNPGLDAGPSSELLPDNKPYPQDSDTTNSISSSSDESSDENDVTDGDAQKCRAPFTTGYGASVMHNAMVLETVGEDHVRVLFTHPTQASMKPCRHFLNGTCRFEGRCRHSHGHLVPVAELQPFNEPDWSNFGEGSRCLARLEEEGLWQLAKVEHIEEEAEAEGGRSFVVHPVSGRDASCHVTAHDVLPLEEEEDSTSDEGDSDDPRMSESEEEEGRTPAVAFLCRAAQTTDRLGAWEDHTKGVGSRLLHKMGYVVGQGLGVRQQGEALPLPIQLLPKGKSLDAIMALKERCGDQDLFDVIKKGAVRKKGRGKKKGGGAAKTRSGGNLKSSASSQNVFEFLNEELTTENHQKKKKTQVTTKDISEKDLNAKSDKTLNIQLFKTEEEISAVDKKIENIEARASTCGRSRTAEVQKLEQYRAKLRKSRDALSRHQKQRKNKKKLTVF